MGFSKQCMSTCFILSRGLISQFILNRNYRLLVRLLSSENFKQRGPCHPIRTSPVRHHRLYGDGDVSPPLFFPTILEFFRQFPIPTVGISSRFPIPTLQYIPGKLPSLLTEGIPAYLMKKKNSVGASKNIPLTKEGILRRMQGIFQQIAAKCFSLFLQYTCPPRTCVVKY
jgi:hypothetical protein